MKESALIDCLACHPMIMIHSLSEDIVVKGFTHNGMLNIRSNMCPYIDDMMNTCKCISEINVIFLLSSQPIGYSFLQPYATIASTS